MFWPYSKVVALATLTMLGACGIAEAQVAAPTATTLAGTVIFHASPAPAAPVAAAQKAPAGNLLAEVSAAAGIPYTPAPSARTVVTVTDPLSPPLCIRAGVGVAIPVLNTPVMTMEHGIIGCPTETAGMPFLLTKDPGLQAPINSRTGDYNLDVTVRYRLMQVRHMQLLANASAQAIGYSLNEPIGGNNVMLSVSLIF